ncbi:MAG: hypothetical protein ABWX68_01245 [Arthrobacter sp.]|uniref:hypothetical protein n=1 Tax=Arthrobacter sp. TaxID=1667 RepID=UPI00347697EE
MTECTGRRRRADVAIDPHGTVNTQRPGNATLRLAATLMIVLPALGGAILAGFVASLLSARWDAIVPAACLGAVLVGTLSLRMLLRAGRGKREDFRRAGGDPSGISTAMFGAMRGERLPDGTWAWTPQASGDYA